MTKKTNDGKVDVESETTGGSLTNEIGADDYKVGNCRPPKDKRFQPGVSGNSRGRTPGSTSLKLELSRVLEQKIIITRNGKPMKVTLREGLLMKVAQEASSGNLKAIDQLLRLSQQFLSEEQVKDFAKIARAEEEYLLGLIADSDPKED